MLLSREHLLKGRIRMVDLQFDQLLFIFTIYITNEQGMLAEGNAQYG